MKNYPPVVVVNDRDEVIGEAALDEARLQGLIYRIVFVMIQNNQGDILLQRRSKDVSLFPDCWDISAGGHVDDGNSYEAAAQAELVEELGLSGLELTPAAHFYTETPTLQGIHARRYVMIFKATYPGLPDQLGLEEVSEVKWLDKAEIRELIEQHPEQVAEGLLHTYNHLLKQQLAPAAAYA